MSKTVSTVPLHEHLNNMCNDIIERTGAEAVFFSSLESTEHVLRTMADAGIRFRVLLGRYDGKYETSYSTAGYNLRWLLESGLLDGQESFMLLNNDFKGYLVYNKLTPTGELNIEDMGYIGQISKDAAAVAEAFTFDPEQGLYYGTVNKKAE